jgi:hypothetical protein
MNMHNAISEPVSAVRQFLSDETKAAGAAAERELRDLMRLDGMAARQRQRAAEGDRRRAVSAGMLSAVGTGVSGAAPAQPR